MYSEKYKFLFIHPQKTAGGSIKQSLRNTFGRENTIEPEHSGHWGYNHFEDYIDGNIKNYFTFSVVRNPWDRAVSYFNHLRRHKNYKKPFGMFCRDVYPKDLLMKPKISKSGKIATDYIIKFENLEEDFDEVMMHLKKQEYFKLLKNDWGNNNKKNYRSFYTKKTKETIDLWLVIGVINKQKK